MGQSRLHAGFVLSDKDNFVIPLGLYYWTQQDWKHVLTSA